MTRKAQQFLAAFAITIMLIGALCLFLMVDLSADRYMPTQSGPLLQVHSVDSSGITFWLFGSKYLIDSSQLDSLRTTLWEYRALLPNSPKFAGAATTKAYRAAKEYLESIRQPEEPW